MFVKLRALSYFVDSLCTDSIVLCIDSLSYNLSDEGRELVEEATFLVQI